MCAAIWPGDSRLPPDEDAGLADLSFVRLDLADLSVSRDDRVALPAKASVALATGASRRLTAVIDFGRNRWSAIELSQDGTDYFDVHHTVHDTLERIVPAELAQNVACWAATALSWLARAMRSCASRSIL